jgi:hypothetical protein
MNVLFKVTGFALLTALIAFFGVAPGFGQSGSAAQGAEILGKTQEVAPTSSNQGDDPDMGGREGVPPNSVGSGTR